MKDNSILNKVRELLGMEVKLGTRKLDDGVTTIEAEEFEAGFQVVIVTEDEQKIPLPVGEYKLEDGLMLVVTEEGLIAEIKEAEEEVVEEEVVEEEVEASVEEAKPIKKTVESIVKETFFSEMETLKKENEELKSELEKFSKVENNENTNEEVVEESTEEVKEEVVELTKEVEAAAKPIVHNPENKEAKIGKTISPNRKRTIMDTVLSKINNANNN